MTTRRNVLLGFGALALTSPIRAATVSRSGTAFGTAVAITVTAGDATHANRAIDAAYAEIRAVHQAASLFDSDSEVSRLNRTGALEQPSPLLSGIIHFSDHIHKLTSGAFDPGIQPLWELWANGNPHAMAVADTLRRVGWSKLHVNDHKLAMLDRGALSFNGIAQGFAADRVMTSLRNAGVISAIIDTGEAGRLNADGRVFIQHPRKQTALGAISLPNGFIAVSGDCATAFTDDFVHHHIFDPVKGFSPRELASVAVVAQTGAMADGLATGFMVMGVAKSLACLGRINGCSALFVDKACNVTLSPGMKKLFQYT